MRPTTTLEMMIPQKYLLNANDRIHWARRSTKVRNLRAHYGRLHGLDIPVTYETCQIDITITWRDLRDRDTANWHPTAKAIVDGLNDVGVFKDDNSRFVKGPFIHRGDPAEVNWPESKQAKLVNFKIVIKEV